MKRTKHVFHKSEKAITPQYQLNLKSYLPLLADKITEFVEVIARYQEIDALCREKFTPEEYHELFCSEEEECY